MPKASLPKAYLFKEPGASKENMETPEAIVLLINIIVIAVGYLFIYPRICGNDINKLATNDVYASVVSISIAGFLFWGKESEFDALLFSLNWFWFSLLTYAALEIPVFIYYANKRKMWAQLKDSMNN